MANHLARLLNFLDADMEAPWEKATNRGLPPAGARVSLWAVATDPESVQQHEAALLHKNQVLQQTWEVKWPPFGTLTSTGWLMRQEKILTFLGLLPLPLLFLENDPFPPAFLLNQIQVDQDITFRVLGDSSRALDKRKFKILTSNMCNFYMFVYNSINNERVSKHRILLCIFNWQR